MASRMAVVARLALISSRFSKTIYRINMARVKGRTALGNVSIRRSFHATGRRRGEETLESKLGSLNSIFAEARMEIQDALDSADTVYFNEDAQIALEMTEEVLTMYEEILESIKDEKELKSVKTSWAMRIEQLKQEAKLLEDTDH
ncbi:hypothetical protein AAMO2058_000199200 [Amorphochlora amoebiformis]|uniref:Uncharacterized protein n=1 Tax=Amorphochlora amoebiformis TaxID=1561963 RepID=A0A7S0H380_9EUKA|mmetsp:Transcript_30441/g.48858  ORF Transcript_30441/g.48858 Transcript_30441/m.48858 type:complete len:145 (+) Transcript_30441:1-435(+)